MILTRALLCVAFACAVGLAAGQQPLPPPMSSAIDRIAKQGQPPANVGPSLSAPDIIILSSVLPGPVPLARQLDQQCSIPLNELKTGDKAKFFIARARVPKNSDDPMPVLRAHVCTQAFEFSKPQPLPAGSH